MTKYAVLLILIAFVIVSLPAVNAQEVPKATKYADATWYVVTYYKFKSGLADDALDLVYKYFVPADKAAGRRVIHFDVNVGEWDHVAFFPLEGPGDLAWQIGPSYVKVLQELVKQGGNDKLLEIEKFESYIAHSKSEVVMRRKVDQ